MISFGSPPQTGSKADSPLLDALSAGASDAGGDHEISSRHVSVRRRMVGRITQVKHLSTEGELKALLQRELTFYPEIGVDQAGTPEIVQAASTESAGSGDSECRPAVPLQN